MGQGQSDEAPEPGDLIEFSRGLYKHYAVAVDKEHVIHLTSADPEGSSSNVLSTGGPMSKVKQERLSDVARKDKYRIIKKYDKKFNPKDPEEIVRNAKAMVGEIKSYNPITANCEHFATEMRYGISASEQADYGIIGGSASMAGVVGVGLRVAIGAIMGGGSRQTEEHSPLGFQAAEGPEDAQ